MIQSPQLHSKKNPRSFVCMTIKDNDLYYSINDDTSNSDEYLRMLCNLLNSVRGDSGISQYYYSIFMLNIHA